MERVEPGSARLRLAAQTGAVRALAGAGRSEEAVPRLLEEVCRGLGWRLGEYWCPGPDGPLDLCAHWAAPGLDGAAFAGAAGGEAFRHGRGLPGRVLESDQPVWVPDVVEDDDFIRSEAARASGLHGAFAIPVPLGPGGRGVLQFFSDERQDPDGDLLETMAGVGALLGQLLAQRATETSLRRAEERLRFQARLLDAVGEAVIATDLDGTILYWNAFAEKLYGWKASEVVGRQVEDVTPSRISREAAMEIMSRLRQGESWSGEFEVETRDGRVFPALVIDSPILNDDGRLIGVIGTSRDITVRKRRETSHQLLAEASRILGSSMDSAATLDATAELAVPVLGDWCIIHVLAGGPGTPATWTTLATETPEDELDAAKHFDRLASAEETDLASAVLAAPGPLHGPAPDGPPLLTPERLEPLGVRSLLTVPMRARGDAVGAMTFAFTRTDRRHDDVLVELAEELSRRAALAFENARLFRDAEAGNRAKTDFLAVVSHELRTPLNAITGYADLLSAGVSGELTPEQAQNLERIKVGAGHLAHLIDEILTFARVEAGRERVELSTVDLGRVAREAVMVVEPDAADKQLPLWLYAPDAGPELRTDGGKVRQILVNLLSNAIKYTEEGVVELTVTPTAEGVELAVRDTGIGIRPGDLDRVFEPFWQAQSPNTRTTGGTGLGLSVNRRLTELLGGEITVKSTPGEGSTFAVRLPDHPPEPADA